MLPGPGQAKWWGRQMAIMATAAGAAGQGTAVGLDIYQWKHRDPASKFGEIPETV